MRIGIFTDTFTPEINGVVTSLRLFMAEFHRQGHEVFVFAPNDSLLKNMKNEPSIRRFRSVLVWGRQVRLSLPLISANSVAKMNFDVIHIQTPGPIGLAGMHIGRKLKIPLVYTYHTHIERYAQYYAHMPAWLEKHSMMLTAKSFYNKHNVVIAPSIGVKDELSKFVSSDLRVIYTGVDIKKNQKMAERNIASQILQRYSISLDDNLLISASRIGKEKNINFIIDAFIKIKSLYPNCKLLFAGGGPEKKTVMKYAYSLVHPKDIIFAGFLTQEELFSLYLIAKVFLFASLTETQGLVTLEALAMGLPVVALEAVGVEDLLANDIGGFMIKNNLDDYVKKTVSLITNKDLLQHKRTEALCRAQDFAIDKMANSLLDLYKELMINNKK